MLKKMLAQLGVEPERVRLEWVSASEGDRFARLVDEMTEEIRELGPFSGNHGTGNRTHEEEEARNGEPSCR